MAAKGNSGALRAHKAESQADTRLELEKALARLRNGQPKRVPKGSKINVSTLAKEADVDRSTIYRYHPAILDEIQRINNSTAATRLKEKHGELAQAEAKARKYRQMLEAAQAHKELLKRENYRLQHRIDELQALLRQRDDVVDELQRKINTKQTAASLK